MCARVWELRLRRGKPEAMGIAQIVAVEEPRQDTGSGRKGGSCASHGIVSEPRHSEYKRPPTQPNHSLQSPSPEAASQRPSSSSRVFQASCRQT